MAAFDILTIPAIEPWQLLGLQSYLLETVATGQSAPTLLIYAMPGRMLSLGRYHLFSDAQHRGGLAGWRRLSGGRVVGSGEGWLGIALILPSRIALLAERDAKLKADQVMNRYARGILGGLRRLGLDCFYPGRDAITIERREIAMCSFETIASGAMLFEAALAVNRGMEEVVHDLERFDPAGQLTCPMYGPESATKVVRELDRDASFEEIAGSIALGYAELLGAANSRELAPLELAQADRRARTLEQSGWFNRTAFAGALRSRMATQLGSVEAHIKTAPDATVEKIELFGDFIANSPGLREFEAAMRGACLDLPSISVAVMKIFGHGDNFILGIGELSNLVKLINSAQ